ncbi:MAG: sigma-70 family RNA polymerase sigma factor [Planctomycetota bacterium]|nr:sigma-70 family RNA polymerase sigma factor [Planctomycetota bacterium]
MKCPKLLERIERLLHSELSFLPNKAFGSLPEDEAELLESLDLSSFERPGLRPSMPSHLARMCETQLLNGQQEGILFRRLNFLKYQANQLRARLNPRKPDRSLVDRTEWLLDEASRTQDVLVSANVRLVMSLIKQLKTKEVTFDELLSDGIVALIRAVEKFDETRGFRFSTYATMVVRRELFRSIEAAHVSHRRFISADQSQLIESAFVSHLPRLPAEQWRTLYETLESMLDELDPRERQIISARFGYESIGSKPSLQALANLLGVCKERVRQLEKRAMAKLKEMAKVRGLATFAEVYL